MVKCIECGGTFTRRNHNANFCSTSCKSTFNNRRAKRGAVLYDLLMIQETDPDTYAKLDLTGLHLDLLRTWADEDHEAGRKRTTKRPIDVKMDTASALRTLQSATP